jgi:hypothetical protein
VGRTTGLEIENELSPAVLQRALPKAFPRLASALTRDREARPALDYEAYRDRRLGSYLDEVLKPTQGRFAESETPNSTLRSLAKVKLARTTLELARHGDLTWADLGAPMQQLVRTLDAFIRRANYLHDPD